MEFSKILILGPANSGGVKEVNDSLYNGFRKLNKEVIYLNTKSDIIKFVFKTKNKKHILCISSLSFGFFGLFFKYSIFIIHGYPYARYLNKINFRLNVLGHKLFSYLNRKTVSVSYLTKFVWENFLFLKIDEVIHNPETTINTKSNNEKIIKELNSIVFTGRIVATKNLNLILEAVDDYRKLNDSNLKFNIIGDGPELSNFIQKYSNPNNIFYGYVSHQDKVDIMCRSNLFISLNEGEPFGLTSLEARLLNLKCVLPAIGGHVEFVDKQSLFLVNDIYSKNEIIEKIHEALNSKSDSGEFKNRFESSVIAQKYLDCIK
jgi:glycosyltransferase involved in cell wall biosynthesis